MLLLPPFVPLLQQLEDLLLHSLGRVAFGEVLRSASEEKVTLSRSDFFSSLIMARMTSRDRLPLLLNFFSRWAWERDGVACSLSMASSSSSCSWGLRKDSS